jgi:hypothetical protein
MNPSHKIDLIACYLLAMFSVRVAFQYKGKFPLGTLQRRFFTQIKEKAKSGPEFDAKDIEKYQNLLNDHQKKAQKLPFAIEARTLLQKSLGFGVLSTNSVHLEGFPFGSVVGFHLTDEGKPFFILSKLSSHTKDLLTDGKSSLTVSSREFKGADDGRVTLTGTISSISDQSERQKLREQYLSKHKDAYWIDFGFVSIEIFRW